MPKDSDMWKELFKGRAGVLTKTDWLSWACDPASKNTPYLYNKCSSHLVGNYENWVSAQPMRDWRLTTFDTVADTCEIPIDEGISQVACGDLPRAWGDVYPWFYMGLENSEKMF